MLTVALASLLAAALAGKAGESNACHSPFLISESSTGYRDENCLNPRDFFPPTSIFDLAECDARSGAAKAPSASLLRDDARAAKAAKRGDGLCHFRGSSYEPAVEESRFCPQYSGVLNCNNNGDIDNFIENLICDASRPNECLIWDIAKYCAYMDASVQDMFEVTPFSNGEIEDITTAVMPFCTDSQIPEYLDCHDFFVGTGPFPIELLDEEGLESAAKAWTRQKGCVDSSECFNGATCLRSQEAPDAYYGFCFDLCQTDGGCEDDEKECIEVEPIESPDDGPFCNTAIDTIRPVEVDDGYTETCGFVSGESCCPDFAGFIDGQNMRTDACRTNDLCKAGQAAINCVECEPESAYWVNDPFFGFRPRFCVEFLERLYNACTEVGSFICPPGFDCSSSGLFCVPPQFVPEFATFETFLQSAPFVFPLLVAGPGEECYGPSNEYILGIDDEELELELMVSGSCPDSVSVTVEGAPEGATVYLVAGRELEDSVETNAGGCDVEVGVGVRRTLTAEAGPDGMAMFSAADLPESVCDLSVQAFVVGDECGQSEVASLD